MWNSVNRGVSKALRDLDRVSYESRRVLATLPGYNTLSSFLLRVLLASYEPTYEVVPGESCLRVGHVLREPCKGDAAPLATSLEMKVF